MKVEKMKKRNFGNGKIFGELDESSEKKLNQNSKFKMKLSPNLRT